MSRKKLLLLLKRYFSRRREVSAVFLYGSRARGTPRPTSDADIAVLLGKRSISGFTAMMRYACDLELLLGLRADVAVLDKADPLLRIQVLTKGIEVFVRDRSTLNEFRSRSQKEYWDFIPLQRIMDDAAAKRIEHMAFLPRLRRA